MKTGGTTRIRLKIAAGYLVIAMLVCGIVHVWLGEWREMGPQEEEYRKINRLRTEVHDIHLRMIELSLLGETVLEWDSSEVNNYHNKRMEIDSLLCHFRESYPAGRIDSVRTLLEDKEQQLTGIMEVLAERESFNEKIADRIPTIVQTSTLEQPKKTEAERVPRYFREKGTNHAYSHYSDAQITKP